MLHGYCTNIMQHPCHQYECNTNKCFFYIKKVNSLMLESVDHQDQYVHICGKKRLPRRGSRNRERFMAGESSHTWELVNHLHIYCIHHCRVRVTATQFFRYIPTEQSNISLEQLTIPFTVKLMIHFYYPGAMGT